MTEDLDEEPTVVGVRRERNEERPLDPDVYPVRHGGVRLPRNDPHGHGPVLALVRKSAGAKGGTTLVPIPSLSLMRMDIGHKAF
jgi:hypothetical protein